jgi:hypothetical protein
MPLKSVSVEIKCSDCHKSRKTKLTPAEQPRTPTAWHKRDDQLYCEGCWSRRYMLRVVSMPVAEPLGCSWEDLRHDLKLMWYQTTRASNWIMTELYTRDVRRNGEKKMPPMPRVYLYPELRNHFPELPPQTVAALEQTCQKRYRSIRYSVIWACSEALPTFRYPVPFPIHNQAWSARIDGEKPIASMRIGEVRREVRLKAGPQFRRQIRSLCQIANGEAVPGEAALYQQGDRLMLKMVAWLPRAVLTCQPAESVLRVNTLAEALLSAVNLKDEKVWMYNGDHLRRWSEEHRRQLQRWSDDAKYEQRPVPLFADRRAASARKYRDRMDSATHRIAADLAGYAYRRRFAEVRYNDTERKFCEGFPWFRLRHLLGEKLEALGIRFVVASRSLDTKGPEPLAGE